MMAHAADTDEPAAPGIAPPLILGSPDDDASRPRYVGPRTWDRLGLRQRLAVLAVRARYGERAAWSASSSWDGELPRRIAERGDAPRPFVPVGPPMTDEEYKASLATLNRAAARLARQRRRAGAR